jgi:hypothetical protein
MSLSSLKPEYWDKELQKTLFVENTAVFLASTKLSSVLSSNGRKAHRPILGKPTTGTYTPYSDISHNQLGSSSEYLEVDTFKYGSVEIDDTDVKQSLYDAGAFAAMSIQKQLNNRIEQAFLNKVKTDAGHSVVAQDVGGTGTGNIAVTTSNVNSIFGAANTKLGSVDVPRSLQKFAVVGPHMLETMRDVKTNRETALGDSVQSNGVVGPWRGWTVVESNNLPYSAVLGLATNPTADDTVTIAGVTFTFKASPAAAGEVDIGASADATRAILTNAVNGASTGKNSATGYIEVSDENRFILSEKRGIVAVNDDSANTMSITGFGDIVVSETLTDATDAWASQTQHAWFGVQGATDLVVQMKGVETTRKEKGFADIVKALQGYGVKTFADGARMLVNVKVDASNWR